MGALLKVILITVLIFWFFKILIREFFPFLLKKYVDKTLENFQQQTKDFSFNEQAQKRKEGEVTIENKAPNRGKSDNIREGDYVEYEEVKD